jgi:hypothetical protein
MSADVPPVAVDFLERLVFDSDPGYAIQTLSSIWGPRLDPELQQFGLSHAEYFVQLCLIYTGEVGNGGHSQFFMNRGGRFIEDTLSALATVGLLELASTLGEAASEFPNHRVPASPDEAEQAYNQLADISIDRLAVLDRRAFSILPRVDAALLAYIRLRRTELLVPETPLSKRVGRRIDQG